MPCYKLTVAYEGTRYSGWQIQPNAPSIQQHLQESLKQLLPEEAPTVIAAGRTDAGVHALNQVAHFNTGRVMAPGRLLAALNGLLPGDIRVKRVEEAPEGFHARYSAIGKVYHYHLFLERVLDPFRQRYCWHVLNRLDLSLLSAAAPLFIGERDFTSFANEAHMGTAARNPVRLLHRLSVCPEEGGIRLEFEGNGFLYKMVRNIVGTMVDIAAHRLNLASIPALFAARDRRQVGRAAPPQGLFLVSVSYPEAGSAERGVVLNGGKGC